MVFRLDPRGLQWDTHMKWKRQSKTYKCNNLEVCSTLYQQLAKGNAISLQDILRSSSIPHVGDDGTPPGTRVVLLGMSAGKTIFGNSKGFWGAGAPPSA